MTVSTETLTRVANLEDLQARERIVVHVSDRPIVLFHEDGQVYAVDNRCPHMGFPLHRGSVRDGILTCHWHHARFDMCSGGTFDQFADDVRTYPVEVRDGDVYLDLSQASDQRAHHRERLRDGLEQQIGLVIAKAVIALQDGENDAAGPFETGLLFGAQYREMGWSQGLTMHTALMNLLPFLAPKDRPLALYQGLSAVARDCAGQPPRFAIQALPDSGADIPTLKRWFRQFIEVRDTDGAERCIASAVRGGGTPEQVADMMYAAATDHRYVQIGHVLDFINKAFEALDTAGWQHAEPVLTSLARGLATASRMEESSSWRNPVDLVALLETAFAELPDDVHEGQGHGAHEAGIGGGELIETLLGDDAPAIVLALRAALRRGATDEELAAAVAYAAALRVAHFHTSNEFGDWDTALHTFTFANAVHQSVRRAPSVELLRGVFDAAMSVYLDRFLNVPSAPLPVGNTEHSARADSNGETASGPDAWLARLDELLDQRQQVNEAGAAVASYLSGGGDPNTLLARLGSLLLREDRDFHTIQMIEAAFRQYERLRGTDAGTHMLVAAARYLAAHAATPRAQLQTYTIAERLHRGEELYEAV